MKIELATRMKLTLEGIVQLKDHFGGVDPRTIRGEFVSNPVSWLVQVKLDGEERPRAFHISFFEYE